MSSSGLIYAVIVGAWAAYLVPMWLRRQDELNEARPTERFSTAIRLLAGRSAMERRASRALNDNDPSLDDASEPEPPLVATQVGDAPTSGDLASPPVDVPLSQAAPSLPAALSPRGDRRAQLLARRRRMVTLLFLAFAVGAVVAAVAGFDFLWVPGLPALLLTLYIGHLRRLERQRYEVKLDRSRAAQAAQRVREREQARTAALQAPVEEPAPPAERRAHLRVASAPEPSSAPSSRQALVEATDHEEWVDGLRERAAAGPDSWEPVPVPLPTYVTAPVAPRVTRGLDLTAPGTWSSGRPAEARRTPLFDQYEEPAPAPAAETRLPRPDDDYAPRPRAANE